MSNKPSLVLGDTEFFTPSRYIVSDGELLGYSSIYGRNSIAKYYDSDGILRTATSDAPRISYLQDGSTDFGLLLEDTADNICLQSQTHTVSPWTNLNSTIEPAGMTPPDGITTTGAALFVDTSLSNPHALEQTYTGSTSVDFCASVYVKRVNSSQMYLRMSDTSDIDYIDIIVDLDYPDSLLQEPTATGGNASVTGGGVIELPNSWRRVWVSGVCDSTTTAHKLVIGISDGTTIIFDGNGIDSIFVWGAQIESGSFPTSYVETTTTSETRAADIPLIDISAASWFNGTLGSIYADFKRESYVTDTTTTVFQIDDGDVNDSIRIEQSSTSKQIECNVTDGAASQVSIVSSTGDANIRSKVAFAYKANDFASSLNGAAVGTDTSGTVPATSVNFRIGYNETGQYLNGIIRNLVYYDTRLSNTDLITLTT